MPMVSTPVEPAISDRATAIARGLLLTGRGVGVIHVEYGKLRLRWRGGGYYWVDLDGNRVVRGKTLLKGEALQPKFIDAMVRAGRGGQAGADKKKTPERS